MYTVLDRIRSKCCVETVLKAVTNEAMGWKCLSTREKSKMDSRSNYYIKKGFKYL